jgi:histidinol-phosphatase (PHP family)
MIDGHIHFHKQPYTLETINKMVAVAMANNIDELYLLDHTHKFYEFKPLYESLKTNQDAWEWYDNKKTISINEYLGFVKEVRKFNLPVKIKFGLEVCFFEEKTSWLKTELNKYPLDFYIGSVHFIDNFPFDLKAQVWENQDIDHLYQRYYEIMEVLIKAQLFTHLAHPDSIKLFNYYPSYDLKPTYERIAKLLKAYHLPTENNTGLCRYDFGYPGLNQTLYESLKANDVKIIKASDAHTYDMIGYKFTEIND